MKNIRIYVGIKNGFANAIGLCIHISKLKDPMASEYITQPDCASQTLAIDHTLIPFFYIKRLYKMHFQVGITIFPAGTGIGAVAIT